MWRLTVQNLNVLLTLVFLYILMARLISGLCPKLLVLKPLLRWSFVWLLALFFCTWLLMPSLTLLILVEVLRFDFYLFGWDALSGISNLAQVRIWFLVDSSLFLCTFPDVESSISSNLVSQNNAVEDLNSLNFGITFCNQTKNLDLILFCLQNLHIRLIFF